MGIWWTRGVEIFAPTPVAANTYKKSPAILGTPGFFMFDE